MDSEKFKFLSKQIVMDYVNKHLNKCDNAEITESDIYIVWSCKILQNNKALLSTILFDGMYYELTYNGDTNEIYLDVYKKFENQCIHITKRLSNRM